MDEDQARLEAEARRQRILNQANNRMDRISGFSKEENDYNVDNASEQKPSNDNATSENETQGNHDNDNAAAAASADAEATDDTITPTPTTDASEEEADAEAEAKAATARKAKIAAMRRRRFKKPTTTTATATETASSPSEPTDTAEGAITEEKDSTTTTTADVKPPETGTPSPINSSTEAAPTTTAAAAATSVSPGKLVEEPAIVGSSNSTEEEETSPSNKSGKKYMGVAKMRRKMIKERAAKNASTDNDDDDDDHAVAGSATTSSAATTATSAQQAVANKVLSNQMKRRQKISLYSLPILMEAVVVLLLFAVGLQVGLQQSHVEYTTILVHNGFAPSQLQQLRIVSFIPDKISAWKQQRLEKKHNHHLGQDAGTTMMKPMGASGEEEFADEALGGDDDVEDDGEENIDPLFGIDLDKVTRGPGPVLFLGRFAVAAHRVNLYFFYHLPIKIYTSIVSKLWSFVDEPPLLCVAALLIRQFIGKTVLGARIPKEAQIKSRGDIEENTTDVLSTMKKVVMTFITNAFPTLVTIAEGWMHLRSDMYVVLFGLFVGWAWHHTYFAAVGDYLTTVAGDGTEDTHPAATQTTTTPITDGATDEL